MFQNVGPVIRAVDVDDYFIKNDERRCENLEKTPLSDVQSLALTEGQSSRSSSKESLSQLPDEEIPVDTAGLPASIAEEIEQALKVRTVHLLYALKLILYAV